jgi:hypothetical protein
VSYSEENSAPDFVQIAAQVRKAMIDCLDRRADGRYYATEAGCTKLRQILAEHGINATVFIDADERFEVCMGTPQ